MEPQILEILTSVAKIVTQNSAQAIFDRIRASKAKNNTEETVNLLEEIINQLITERIELQTATSALADHMAGETISDDEIKFITEKLVPVLGYLIPDNEGDYGNSRLQVIVQLKTLMSPEMLKIAQLIGFNYRRALGDPLANLVSKKIQSFEPQESSNSLQIALLNFQTELMKISQDPEANRRYREIKNELNI